MRRKRGRKAGRHIIALIWLLSEQFLKEEKTECIVGKPSYYDALILNEEEQKPKMTMRKCCPTLTNCSKALQKLINNLFVFFLLLISFDESLLLLRNNKIERKIDIEFV